MWRKLPAHATVAREEHQVRVRAVATSHTNERRQKRAWNENPDEHEAPAVARTSVIDRASVKEQEVPAAVEGQRFAPYTADSRPTRTEARRLD